MEVSISAQKYGDAGFTNNKICAWHNMERCILDSLLSHISHLFISFSVLFYLFPQWLRPSSRLKQPHQTLVFGANPAAFTHPDPALWWPSSVCSAISQPRGLVAVSAMGTAGFRAAKWPSRQLSCRQHPGSQTPLCPCAGRTNVRWGPQGTFELHLSLLSRVCCLRDWCAWYQGSFGAACSTQWGSSLRAWWSFSSNYF